MDGYKKLTALRFGGQPGTASVIPVERAGDEPTAVWPSKEVFGVIEGHEYWVSDNFIKQEEKARKREKDYQPVFGKSEK